MLVDYRQSKRLIQNMLERLLTMFTPTSASPTSCPGSALEAAALALVIAITLRFSPPPPFLSSLSSFALLSPFHRYLPFLQSIAYIGVDRRQGHLFAKRIADCRGGHPENSRGRVLGKSFLAFFLRPPPFLFNSYVSLLFCSCWIMTRRVLYSDLNHPSTMRWAFDVQRNISGFICFCVLMVSSM